MTLQEQAIEEIKHLPPQHLIKAYNYIRLLKENQQLTEIDAEPPYMKIRKILSKSKISLSEDIIAHREDRI